MRVNLRFHDHVLVDCGVGVDVLEFFLGFCVFRRLYNLHNMFHAFLVLARLDLLSHELWVLFAVR